MNPNAEQRHALRAKVAAERIDYFIESEGK